MTGLHNKPEGIQLSEPYDFKMVSEPLDKIYQNVIAHLNFESGSSPTYFFISTILKLSYQTYRLITRIVAEKEIEKFPVQAHILSRSIIDAMYVVMALLDHPDNTRKYEVAGYREQFKKLEQERETYGNDSKYEAYLEDKLALVEHLKNSLKLTKEEILNPIKNIPYWPIPGQLIKSTSPIVLSKGRLDFLKEIYKWHYSEPSGVSHLSWEGMSMAVFASMPEYHWDPGKYESDAVYTGILFLLIMLSEIEVVKEYGLTTELQYLWTILGEYYQEVKEYYDMRYRTLFVEHNS